MASCRPSVRQVSSTSHRGRFCNRLAGQKRHSLAWSSALWSPQTESPHLARPWCLWCAHRSYPEARHSSGACWSVTWSRKSRGKELLGEALRHGQLVVDFHEFQRGSLPREGSSRMPPQGSRRQVRRDKKVSMIAANANGAIKQAIWETRSCSLGLETCDAISSTSHLIIHQDQSLIPSPLLPNSFPTALALVINVTIQNWSVHLENEKGLRNIMKPIIFTVRVLWHSSSVPSVLKHGLLKNTPAIVRWFSHRSTIKSMNSQLAMFDDTKWTKIPRIFRWISRWISPLNDIKRPNYICISRDW